MKRPHLRLFLTILLLLALTSSPAQAMRGMEPPTITMKPIVRTGDLPSLFSETGFACPEGFSFGMSLDDAIEALPLSETMRPGEEAFDERKYVESPENGFCSLNPFVYYAFEEIDDVLELVLEFDDNHELFGYWLASTPVKLADMTDSERENVPARLQRLIGTFSEVSASRLTNVPVDIDGLDLAFFEAGGRLRVFFPMDDGTFCQVCANVFQGTFLYQIGIGLTEDWPGVKDIIEESA